jgi:putative sigma-54 modulation protein
MQINVSGHHVEVTPALRDYVSSKLQRLERHVDGVTNAHVVLSIDKLQQKAEATLHLAGAKLFADAVHDDMYAAIDALADKLDRQAKRHKERRSDHRGPPAVKGPEEAT